MSRWIAGVAVPVAVVDAAFQRSLFVASMFGLFLLAVGLAAAFEISRRISRDIVLAAGSAEIIAPGHHPRFRSSPALEVERPSDPPMRPTHFLRPRERGRAEKGGPARPRPGGA